MAAPRMLITGATGFVGSHVVDRLASLGVEIRALVRPTSDVSRIREKGVELVTGALTEPEALQRAVVGVDVVVHLAALTHAASAAEYHRVNEAGTRDLVHAALGADPRPRRFVYLSSLAAAGPSLDGRPVGPEDPPRPLTAYGRSKLAGEAACRAVADIEVVVLRASAVYGPRDRELLRFFRLAGFGVMPIPAGPERLLQLVHVSDLADAVVKAALASGSAGLFHIAEARAYSWREIAGMVAAAVGARARPIRVPGSLMTAAAAVAEGASRIAGRSTMFNTEKVRELLAPGWLCETDTARRVFGFEAAIPLRRGLDETANWYRQNGWL